MAGVGMDRNRVYEFLDSDTATKAAQEQPAAKMGGVVVELDDGSSDAQRVTAAGKLTPREKSSRIQAQIAEIRRLNLHNVEHGASNIGKRNDVNFHNVATLVSMRPSWPSEIASAGFPDDRGRPQFECLTSGINLNTDGVSGHTTIDLHGEGRASFAKGGKGGGTGASFPSQEPLTEKDTVPLTTERAEVNAVFGPTDHESMIDVVAKNIATTNSGAAIILHGQTGSGKTYTAVRLQRAISKKLLQMHDEIILRYFEISHAGSRDLIANLGTNDNQKNLLGVANGEQESATSETTKQPVTAFIGTTKVSTTETVCRSPEEVLQVLQRAEEHRSSRETTVHEASSRSHAFCCMTVRCDKKESTHINHVSEIGDTKETIADKKEKSMTQENSTITVIDLAGSERSLDTFANRGKGMEETKYINTSLSCLQECVRCLCLEKAKTFEKLELETLENAHNHSENIHIPFRRSILTMLLRDLLGGPDANARKKLLWVAHLSPMSYDAPYSRRTLHFLRSLREAYDCSAGDSAANLLDAKNDPLHFLKTTPLASWTRSQVSMWVGRIEEKKFTFLVEAGVFRQINGKQLKMEWKGDLVQKIVSVGGAEEDGEKIYELVHQRVREDQKSGRR